VPDRTPEFNVLEIPFSRRGSWLDISPVIGLHRSSKDLHLVSHQNGIHPVLALIPQLEGASGSTTVRANASCLTWEFPGGASVEAVFETTDTVRLRGVGCELRMEDASPGLTPFTGAFMFANPSDGSVTFTSYETGRRYRVTPISGPMSVIGSEALGQSERSVVLGGSGDTWEAVIEEFDAARRPYSPRASFEDARAEVVAEFHGYVNDVAEWRTDATPAVELAAYVLWSATVSPYGFLRRESVLMSKHWMDKVWSWDHCFNALALRALPDLSWDQFLVPFDHMDSAGALPDSVAHSEVLYNFVKPPIHGWTIDRMLRYGIELTDHQAQTAFESLARWTDFWLVHRRLPGHSLPYYQHGNDSGWDNSTTFDRDRVIEAPDLAAFLLIQLSVVTQLGKRLGQDVSRYASEYERLRIALKEELWRGDHFIAQGAATGVESKATSLLNYLPVAAAGHLEPHMVAELAKGVSQFMTDYGPATQLIDSPEYESDGYWRGPIWAPSTILIEDGLRQAGEVALADTVRLRFLHLCERSGFAENFDAISGEGLRDRAYTWTASAYLLFAHDATMANHAN